MNLFCVGTTSHTRWKKAEQLKLKKQIPLVFDIWNYSLVYASSNFELIVLNKEPMARSMHPVRHHGSHVNLCTSFMNLWTFCCLMCLKSRIFEKSTFVPIETVNWILQFLQHCQHKNIHSLFTIRFINYFISAKSSDFAVT